MTDYKINQRTGEVHVDTCNRRIDPGWVGVWSPERQHLILGVKACPQCLPDGLPPMPPAPLLEDADGAPYPGEVQALVRLLQANTGTLVVDAIMRALEAMRRSGIQQAVDAARGAVPSHMELRPDGSTDPQAALYVEGAHDTYAAVEALLHKPKGGDGL